MARRRRSGSAPPTFVSVRSSEPKDKMTAKIPERSSAWPVPIVRPAMAIQAHAPPNALPIRVPMWVRAMARARASGTVESKASVRQIGAPRPNKTPRASATNRNQPNAGMRFIKRAKTAEFTAKTTEAAVRRLKGTRSLSGAPTSPANRGVDKREPENSSSRARGYRNFPLGDGDVPANTYGSPRRVTY